MENRMLSTNEYWGLGKVPVGIGAVLRGWHGGIGSVLDFRAMTPACKHNCFHCFTDKRKKTLALAEIMHVVYQAADLGFRGIDYLGEGEPTLDKDFFKIIEYTSNKCIVPVVFTDAATMLRDRDFIKRVYDSNASVCPKCDSLFDRDFQNWVVGDKTGEYFDQRNEAIQMLIDQGFNRITEDGTTRLGFDMVVCKRNVQDVGRTLRYCRENNLWVVFTTYLPAGRSRSECFDKSLILSPDELRSMRQVIKEIDNKYNFIHPIYNNFATSPCVEFMQIYGDGRVSPCPGNETIVGSVKTDFLCDLKKRVMQQFPCHNKCRFDGNCPYRSY